jgi:hypothetical protein
MIAMSVVIALSVLVRARRTVLRVAAHVRGPRGCTVGLFLAPLVMTVIQYAWTFFFLRLDELDQEAADEPYEEVERGGGGGGGMPRLKVVHGGRQDPPNRH